MISNWAPSPPGFERSKKGASGLSWTAARIASARMARLKLRTILRSGGDRRRVVGRIDRHQGRPPLSDEPPGVLEAILLPGGIGVAGVHRNLVGSGNVE